MSKTAYLFPGQGSQFVGMGRDLYDAYPAARALFDEADAVLGVPLSRLCFEGPEAELKETQNTQPAIFVHSVAALRVAGLEPTGADCVAAGHSLGEYSAYVAAGAIGFADALRLVRRRGELMSQAGKERPGTMAAILGLSAEQVEAELANLGPSAGLVRAANFNSPGQVVISGEVPAVERAMEALKALGAKRAIRLEVAGAFHSPLMESAAGGLGRMLAETTIETPRCDVVANESARVVGEPGEIRASLARQLLAPVRWEQSVQAMLALGVTHWLEIGPGKVLAGLVRAISRESEARPLGTAAQIQEFLETRGGTAS